MGNTNKFRSFFKSEAFSWISLIFFALALALVLRTFVFRPVYVEGTSMNSTLVQGDLLFLNKFQYYFTPPKRNDIVVIDYQVYTKNSLIKRIIGLPGETVSFKGGRVYINGVVLDEPEIAAATNPGPEGTEFVLGPTDYFVMGDNRLASYDSRYFGQIERSKILGLTTFRFWPLNKIGTVK